MKHIILRAYYKLCSVIKGLGKNEGRLNGSSHSNSYKIVLIILAVIFLWMLTGIFKSKPIVTKDIHSNVSVKVISSQAENKTRYIKLNGVTSASKIIHILPETDGKIERLYVSEGEGVKKDQKLAQIEIKTRQKILDEAKSLYERELLSYNATYATYKKRLSSEIALADAKLRLNKAESQLKSAEEEMDKTVPRAPEDGYIDSLYVEEGDLVSPMSNTKIATFISNKPSLVVVHVPEKNIRDARDAKYAKIAIKDDEYIDARVTFLGRIADPSNRAFRMEMEVTNPGFDVNSGETIKVLVPLKEAQAHKVPKSTITLDLKGELKVKTVTDGNIVKEYAVEIFSEDEKGFWIVGLPKEATIITLGQQYVKEGEIVKINDKAT